MAWHVNFNDSICMQDIWETFGPCIMLLQFGMLFHFSPMLFEFLIHILCTTGTVLSGQGVTVVAPFAVGFLDYL
jgi:hypothetical protein